MPLEPLNAPRRAMQRMYRRIQQPYRILTLSERMNRYRPILPVLPEEEAPDQMSNIEQRRASSRFKRRAPIRARNQRTLSAPDDSTSSMELQVVPPPYVQHHTAEWHAGEPEIVATSDVQLQTDAMFYEVHHQLEHEIGNVKDLEAHGEQPKRERPESPLRVICYGFSRTMMNKSTQTSECFELSSIDFVQIVNSRAPKTDEEADVMYRQHSRALSLPDLPAPSVESRRVANRVIRHARYNKTLSARDMYCLDCDLFPVSPVTGPCGHTRCYKCIQENGPCPCGAEPPLKLHVNTAIQYLLRKMFNDETTGTPSTSAAGEGSEEGSSRALVRRHPRAVIEARRSNNDVILRWMRRGYSFSPRNQLVPFFSSRVPMTAQARFEYARRLLSFGRYRDAAPHFARVGAEPEPIARVARTILSQIICLLMSRSERRNLTRFLFRSVRYQAAASWLRTDDLECVLCFNTYTRPVTTPCGHTYCRTCIERALDYRKVCALCLRPLYDFDLAATRETTFMNAALDAIDAVSESTSANDPDVIPIFVCTVAYPSVPCPLFIFDPRYWIMIRRVLESGSRKFGMVAYERDRNYSDFGTILEVRDCVQLEDGRSFLSTVGVGRFRIIERDVLDGCDVARIQPLEDIIPEDDLIVLNMRLMATKIMQKALLWLNGMNYALRVEIETAFGPIPWFYEIDIEDWWEIPDGPTWLWWLVAILPLRSEIKVLILSTKNLMKRMMAVLRTLEVMDQVSITTAAHVECEFRSVLNNPEAWLERGA